MKNFLSNFSERLSQFMYGRNGYDKLAIVAFVGGLIFWFISSFFASQIIGQILSLISIALFVYSMFRMYSKNVSARRAENAKFEQLLEKPSLLISKNKSHWDNRATTKYFKCKNCGQSLSVPKGKGKLRVTCPKCHSKTEIKS